MNRYIIQPNRWTRMQDAGLVRSEFLAGEELARRALTGDPAATDLQVLGRFLSRLAAEFATAWAAARERRLALRALKRVDRRLLRDLGIERGRLREVVDAMAAQQAAVPRNEPRTTRTFTVESACAVKSPWMGAHPAA